MSQPRLLTGAPTPIPRRRRRPRAFAGALTAKRGVFAYIVDSTPEDLRSAIDITLQRFTEYHSLQGAFGRRAMIEQAKGI
jgi:AmiR/NasT family two-component response regulator